jgi:hypothetical protein
LSEIYCQYPIVDWALLGGLARKLFTFKAQFDAFIMGAIADLAEPVLSCNATNCAR